MAGDVAFIMLMVLVNRKTLDEKRGSGMFYCVYMPYRGDMHGDMSGQLV